MDKEIEILNLIQHQNGLSQRELAQCSGLSLGHVNILLKKMIREGLIKLERMPANRALYILTAKGMQEKVDKTLYYVRHYYQYIKDTKEKLKIEVRKHPECTNVYLDIQDETLRDIMKQIADELDLIVLANTQPDNCMTITDSNNGFELPNHYINIRRIIAR